MQDKECAKKWNLLNLEHAMHKIWNRNLQKMKCAKYGMCRIYGMCRTWSVQGMCRIWIVQNMQCVQNIEAANVHRIESAQFQRCKKWNVLIEKFYMCPIM